MFDLHTSILDAEYGEELDEGRLEQYIHELMAEFEESPEAEVVMKEFDTSLCWPAKYMRYAAQYFCATPATVTSGETAEILFELLPRKVSVQPDAAHEIVAELRAFWQFLRRTRSLEKADAMLELLTDEDADRLEADLADPSNFGMAKSIFAAGTNAGFEMANQADLNRFILAYNAAQLGGSRLDDGKAISTTPMQRAAPIHKKLRRVGSMVTSRSSRQRRRSDSDRAPKTCRYRSRMMLDGRKQPQTSIEAGTYALRMHGGGIGCILVQTRGAEVPFQGDGVPPE